MPSLYCEAHGEERLRNAEKTDWSKYPDEYLKIAKGYLLSSWLCDRCNEELHAGQVAYFIGSYPNAFKDALEYHYFHRPERWLFSATERTTPSTAKNFIQSFEENSRTTTENEEKYTVGEIFLEVPYSEKNEAKKLGARWNAKFRKWYVPQGKDPELFKRWMPLTSPVGEMTLAPPIFLLHSYDICWKCNEVTPVITLGSERIRDSQTGELLYEDDELHLPEDILIISYITNMPAQLEKILFRAYPFYFLDYSKALNSRYFINHCSCGAKLGDHYLTHPGGSFVPLYPEDASYMTLSVLFERIELPVTGSHTSSSLNIRQCAKLQPIDSTPIPNNIEVLLAKQVLKNDHLVLRIRELEEDRLNDPRWLKFDIALESPGTPLRLVASVNNFSVWAPPEKLEKIRWYLEDYSEAQYLEKNKKRAEEAINSIYEIGEELFISLFAGEQIIGEFWAYIHDRLQSLHIEILPMSYRTQAIPWELIFSPFSGFHLALECRSFVRGTPWAPKTPELPRLREKKLRILLVTSRPPIARDDIPRNVIAEMLYAALGEIPEDIVQLDTLEPPTFDQLSKVLHTASKMGHPYHVVHFDGHGSFTDNVLLSSESKVKRGYVLFENPDSYDCPIYVDGECFAKLLKQAGVPWLILNACESAQIQPPRPKYLLIDWVQQSNEEARVKSFDLEAMENGLIGVVAMRNKITVVAAQIFFKEFYNALARGALISEAAARGRRVLARTHNRLPACTLFDWTIPVVYESKPFSMFNNREEWFLYEKNAPNDIKDP